MTRSNLRIAIAVLTLATALIHLYLPFRSGQFQPLFGFIANGLGYLVLLGLFLAKPPFVAGREKPLHYVYIGYTVVTIVAYFAISPDRFGDPLGLITKAIEVLLVVALWLHLREA